MKARTAIKITTVLVGLGIALIAWWVYEASFAPMPESIERPVSENLVQPKAHSIQYLGKTDTPTVLADALDHSGALVELACTTCHTTRMPNRENRKGEGLDEFHQGLQVQHGSLSCLSCHNPENYDTLRLADGEAVGYGDVMKLCAQCHGPQYRDYRNGSHGGMAGYWDLDRGPRVRNTCTVCHDAHSPAYPQVMPVFPPKDLDGPSSTRTEPHH
jgi:hypothetical protein